MGVKDLGHVQRSLLLCGVGDLEPCEELSDWIVFGLRPGRRGGRTDAVIIGTCTGHRDDLSAEIVLVELGYRPESLMVLPWAALGEFLQELERSGWLDFLTLAETG